MKKEVKRKIKAVAVAGILGVAALFGTTGCSSDSKEYIDETNIQKTWSNYKNCGIEVIKEAGVEVSTTEAIMDKFILNMGSSIVTHFIPKMQTIRILPPGAGLNANLVEGMFSIGCDENMQDILDYLIPILLSKQFDKSEETVRLAATSNRNQRTV